MAVIHHTTLTPGKLELLAGWLPSQPWYTGTGHPPELTKAGGFRLDDPDGDVGIEFMAVTDQSGRESGWLTADGVTVRGLLVTAHAGRPDPGRDDL